jgi:hypothetical protein
MREQSSHEASPGHGCWQNLQVLIGLGRGAPVDDSEIRRPSCRSLDQPGQAGPLFAWPAVFLAAALFSPSAPPVFRNLLLCESGCGAASMAEIFGEQGVSNAASDARLKIDACDWLEPIRRSSTQICCKPHDIRSCLPLSFGWQDFLSAYLIDQVFSFEIGEMRSLFIVDQICTDPLPP